MLITRFAPSPTGLLHIGNIRTALICFLYAKKNNGNFHLRLDDTDVERSTVEYAENIKSDLSWLGLNWEKLYKQSDRLERYQEVIRTLVEEELLYPCYETAEEIDMKRKMLLSRGLPPIYDREALRLTAQQKNDFENQGRPKHWRFKLDQSKTIQWHDEIKGEIKFEAKYLSDPVLIRANGTPTYMLPSAIDDMDMKVTHIIRGEDHVNNTAIQIQLFDAMKTKAPNFAHHSLLKASTGKISKRDGGHDVKSLSLKGIESMAINSYLSKLGTGESFEAAQALEELINEFDIQKFGKAAAIFDDSELLKVNQRYIQKLSYSDVKQKDELAGVDPSFFEAIKNNIYTLKDVAQWNEICKSDAQYQANNEDIDFLELAASVLPPEPWDANTWSTWIDKIKQTTDRKGKQLFLPIRFALTGKNEGPEMKLILPFMERDLVIKRLKGH